VKRYEEIKNNINNTNIFDFLSLFAEYSFSINYTNTTTKQSVTGVVSKDSSSDFSVATEMGNDSKIGIALYFNRLKNKK